MTTIHLLNNADQPHVLYANGLPSTTTLVEGFTLTSVPTEYSAAYVVYPGKVTFRECVFRDLVGDFINAGLYVMHGDVDVIDCKFVNCQTTGDENFGAFGAGIVIGYCP